MDEPDDVSEPSMFYGKKLEPGKLTAYVPTPDFERLHLSQACIEVDVSASKKGASVFVTVKGDDEEAFTAEKICICTLLAGKQHHVSLDVILDKYTEIEAKGDTPIYISGYLLPFMKTSDDAGIPPYMRGAFQNAMMGGLDDEDDEDDESDSEGDDEDEDDSEDDDELDDMAVQELLTGRAMGLLSNRQQGRHLDEDEEDEDEDDDDDVPMLVNALGQATALAASPGSTTTARGGKATKYNSSRNGKARAVVIEEITDQPAEEGGVERKASVPASVEEADEEELQQSGKVAEVQPGGPNDGKEGEPAGSKGANKVPSKGSVQKAGLSYELHAVKDGQAQPQAEQQRQRKGLGGQEDGESGAAGDTPQAGSAEKGKKGKRKAKGGESPISPGEGKSSSETGQHKKAKMSDRPHVPSASPSPTAAQPKAVQEKGGGVNGKVHKFENGFEVHELHPGPAGGVVAKPGKKVTMWYKGWLPNGKVFDESTRKGFTFRLGIGEVIKGWDVGIKGMRVGDKRHLVIPPQMAYGTSGIRDAIPPNATLTFDVELLGVR